MKILKKDRYRKRKQRDMEKEEKEKEEKRKRGIVRQRSGMTATCAVC